MKHRLVFNNRPGICKAALHQINLVEGFRSKALKPYRIPEALRAEVDRQIDQLLEAGKIRKSTSCFSHPIVCVKKANGETSICTDLRYVNSLMIRDSYQMPLADD